MANNLSERYQEYIWSWTWDRLKVNLLKDIEDRFGKKYTDWAIKARRKLSEAQGTSPDIPIYTGSLGEVTALIDLDILNLQNIADILLDQANLLGLDVEDIENAIDIIIDQIGLLWEESYKIKYSAGDNTPDYLGAKVTNGPEIGLASDATDPDNLKLKIVNRGPFTRYDSGGSILGYITQRGSAEDLYLQAGLNFPSGSNVPMVDFQTDATIVDWAKDNVSVSALAIDTELTERLKTKEDHQSSWYEGGEITSGPGANQVTISAGEGIIASPYLVPGEPPETITTLVDWAEQIFTIPDPVGIYLYEILINTSGIVEYRYQLEPQHYRDYIVLGFVSASDNVIVGHFNAGPNTDQVGVTTTDLINFLPELVKKKGFIIDQNATIPMSLDMESGARFIQGANWLIDYKDPNVLNYSQVVELEYVSITQLGALHLVGQTLIDPTKWDNAGTITTLTAANKATIQYLWLTITGTYILQYGQTVYNSVDEARLNSQNDLANFITAPIIRQALILCQIIVSKNCNDLTDLSEGEIINIGFGPALGGGLSFTTWGAITGVITDQTDLWDNLMIRPKLETLPITVDTLVYTSPLIGGNPLEEYLLKTLALGDDLTLSGGTLGFTYSYYTKIESDLLYAPIIHRHDWSDIDNILDKHLIGIDATNISEVLFIIENGQDVIASFAHTHPEYAPIDWVNAVTDNYQSWELQVDSVKQKDVISLGIVDFIGGDSISLSYATDAITITNDDPDQLVILTGAGTTVVTGTYPSFIITSNDQFVGTVTSVSATGSILSNTGTATDPIITHAITTGHKHIPFGGATNDYLKWSEDGTAIWSTIPANTNDFLDSASFNTGTGLLTMTVGSQSDVVVDLDGRYVTNYQTLSWVSSIKALTISSGNTVTLTHVHDWADTTTGLPVITYQINSQAGIDVELGTSPVNIPYTHPDDKYLSAVDASDLSAVLFTVINGVNITEDFSHIHGYDNYEYWVVKVNGFNASNITSKAAINFIQAGGITISRSGDDLTISSVDTDSIDYINAGSFGTGTGDLTLTGIGNAGATINLDGRYLESLPAHTHPWEDITNLPDITYTLIGDVTGTITTELGQNIQISTSIVSPDGKYLTNIDATNISEVVFTMSDEEDILSSFAHTHPEYGLQLFVGLFDTPETYIGEQGKLVKVNATEDGLIFGDPSGTTVSWGDIQGTLSNQTDLQAELDAKENWLGNPSVSGYLLQSTTGGVRSWINVTDVGTTDYISGGSFGTANGVLTLTGIGSAGASINLDGRYITDHQTLSWVASTKALTISDGNTVILTHYHGWNDITTDKPTITYQINSQVGVDVALGISPVNIPYTPPDDRYLSAVDASDMSAVLFTITNGDNITEDFSHIHGDYDNYEYWELQVEAVTQKQVGTKQSANFKAGANVTLSYNDGVVITAADTNDIDYINAGVFGTTTGDLTLTGIGNAGAIINLDGRYLESLPVHTHPWSDITDLPTVDYTLFGDATGSASVLLGDDVSIPISIDFPIIPEDIHLFNIDAHNISEVFFVIENGDDITTSFAHTHTEYAPIDWVLIHTTDTNNPHQVAWDQLIGSQPPPIAHTHPWSEITSLPDIVYTLTGDATGTITTTLGSDVTIDTTIVFPTPPDVYWKRTGTLLEPITAGDSVKGGSWTLDTDYIKVGGENVLFFNQVIPGSFHSLRLTADTNTQLYLESYTFKSILKAGDGIRSSQLALFGSSSGNYTELSSTDGTDLVYIHISPTTASLKSLTIAQINTSLGNSLVTKEWVVSVNEYVENIAFNTGTGILTLERNIGADLTQDLDGRYIDLFNAQTVTGAKTWLDVANFTANAGGGGTTYAIEASGSVNLASGENYYINDIPISVFIDAPSDGNLYARKDAAWSSLGTGAGTVTDLSLGANNPSTVTILNTGGDNVTLLAATTTVAGVMTAALKTKLDGIATGANLYVHPNHSGMVTSVGDGDTIIEVIGITEQDPFTGSVTNDGEFLYAWEDKLYRLDVDSLETYMQNNLIFPTVNDGELTMSGTGALSGSASFTANQAGSSDFIVTHNTTSGYKHIPSGGSSNQWLKYSASGTAMWSSLIDPVWIMNGNLAQLYSASGHEINIRDNETLSIGTDQAHIISYDLSVHHVKLEGRSWDFHALVQLHDLGFLAGGSSYTSAGSVAAGVNWTDDKQLVSAAAIDARISAGSGGGTVTSVSAGNGMDFTTITTTGTVTMGTPASLTGATTNIAIENTHTHEIITGSVVNGGTNLVDANDVYDFVVGLGYGTGNVSTIDTFSNQEIVVGFNNTTQVEGSGIHTYELAYSDGSFTVGNLLIGSALSTNKGVKDSGKSLSDIKLTFQTDARLGGTDAVVSLTPGTIKLTGTSGSGAPSGFMISTDAPTNSEVQFYVLSTSDKRLKKDIMEVDPSLAYKLNPVKFTWKDSELTHYGFIAQDVEKVIPEIAYTNPNGMMAYNIPSIGAINNAAIQELKQEINKLAKQLAELSKK